VSKSEFVYAIRVTHTKKGKPRKKRVWARQNSRGGWRINGQSLSWLMCGGSLSVWIGLEAMKRRIKPAERALGCHCRVVKIELKAVNDEQKAIFPLS